MLINQPISIIERFFKNTINPHQKKSKEILKTPEFTGYSLKLHKSAL